MKHYCIVGAGAELAKPLILELLQDGYQVTAVCRNTAPNFPQDWRGRLKVLLGVDLSARCADLFKRDVGPVDGVITLTGKVRNNLLSAQTIDTWGDVIDDTLTSVFNTLRDVLLKDGANVVVVGSIVGSTGGYGCANYAAAKAGLVGLVRAAANEWAARDICVNLLELGYVDAGMGKRLTEEVRQKVLKAIPLGRFAEPAEVSRAIRFLLETRYMTGDVLTFAGGLR